jgi:drug/metabolite transporter (DMT)-like permease
MLAKAATTVSFTMLYPIVTVLLALVALREKPHPWQLTGIVGSLGAIYLLGVSQPGHEGFGRWMLYALACVGLWGVGALIMKVATKDVSAAMSTIWFLAAFIPLTVWILMDQPTYLVDKPIDWNPPLRDWLIVTALGLTFGIGNLTLLAAYRHDGKAAIVTPLTGLYPVVTIPLAILLFGEKIGFREWTGIALAIVSAVALMREPTPPTKEVKSTSDVPD